MAETRRKIQGCAIGLAAYDELIAHLNGMLSRRRTLTEHNVSKVMKWSGQPLTQFIEARTAAVDYLQMIREHLEEDELEHLDEAIAEYQKVVGLLKAVQRILPSLEVHEAAPTEDKTKVRLGLGLSRMHLWMHPNREAQTPEEAMSHFKPKCRAAIKVLERTVTAETKASRKIRDVLQTSEKVKM